MNAPEALRLSPLEARILGVLVEKQLTTPDYYPLTLNALQAGCNQKSSRDPVMNVSEAELQQALDELRLRTLVVESSGSRVMRYAHNLDRALRLPSPVVALLASLMLRGPQTGGELRGSTDRLYRFPDISSVEAYLEEMAGREPPLALCLPRLPGAREPRWAHLLCGVPQPEPARAAPGPAHEEHDEVALLREELARLREEVAALRAEVDSLRR